MAYYNTTKWHFEDRIAANGDRPTYREVSDERSGWRRLPKEESLYHIDDVGKDEIKYVHSDGREAVFHGDTLEPMTDPRYMATYNYVVIIEKPENFSIGGYSSLLFSYAGHALWDVVPYELTLRSNTREQFEDKLRSIFN